MAAYEVISREEGANYALDMIETGAKDVRRAMLCALKSWGHDVKGLTFGKTEYGDEPALLKDGKVRYFAAIHPHWMWWRGCKEYDKRQRLEARGLA